MTDPDIDAVQAAQRLEQSVNGLRTEIATLHQFGRRNRHFIWGLAISIVLDIALSIVVALVAVQATEASDRATEATSLANRNRQTQITTCESGNETRSANIKLWNYVLDLAAQSNPHPTAEQTKRIGQFKTYLAQVFAPRDCSSLATTPLPPPPTTSTVR